MSSELARQAREWLYWFETETFWLEWDKKALGNLGQFFKDIIPILEREERARCPICGDTSIPHLHSNAEIEARQETGKERTNTLAIMAAILYSGAKNPDVNYHLAADVADQILKAVEGRRS